MAEIEGFWSYVHQDDETESGRISQLARDVSSHYEMITGDSISLFLDRDAIDWGEDWRNAIDTRLGSIAFFIPVITPRYFMSPECRRELQSFARKAINLGIADLILPLIYLDFPNLHNPESEDDLIELIRKFQWEYWTENRFSDVDSESYRRGVSKLASRLVEANLLIEKKDLSLETRKEISPDEETDDSPGLIDRLATMEETLPGWVTTLEDLEKEILLVGSILDESTAEINKATAQAKGFSNRLIIIRRLSNNLKEPSESIWKLGNSFASQAHEVDDGIRDLISLAPLEIQNDPSNKKSVCNLYNSIKNMYSSAHEGFNSTKDMINAITPLEKMSRDLRPALRRMRQGLTIMIEAEEVLHEWVELIESTQINCDNNNNKNDI